MLWAGCTSPIVPYGADQTVYLVVEALGAKGFSRETAVERTDLEAVITDLMSGRFDNPIGILAFNTLEHWPNDISKDVAREIQCRCDIEGDDVPDYLEDFVGNSISRAAVGARSGEVQTGFSSGPTRGVRLEIMQEGGRRA